MGFIKQKKFYRTFGSGFKKIYQIRKSVEGREIELDKKDQNVNKNRFRIDFLYTKTTEFFISKFLNFKKKLYKNDTDGK